MKKLLLIVAIALGNGLSFAQDTVKIKASYYHKKYEGRKTANGDIYREDSLTAASNYYKLGTMVLVINPETGEQVIVKINDRLAKHMNHRIDLSKKAFKKIANVKAGVVPVKTISL